MKDVPKGPGDALRPTSLRQALTGAQKSATTSKTAKVIKKERRGTVQLAKRTNPLPLKWVSASMTETTVAYFFFYCSC